MGIHDKPVTCFDPVSSCSLAEAVSHKLTNGVFLSSAVGPVVRAPSATRRCRKTIAWRAQFGRRSEKLDPEQLLLAIEDISRRLPPTGAGEAIAICCSRLGSVQLRCFS